MTNLNGILIVAQFFVLHVGISPGGLCYVFPVYSVDDSSDSPVGCETKHFRQISNGIAKREAV